MKALLQLDSVSKHFPQTLTSAGKLQYLLRILSGRIEHNKKTILSDITFNVNAGRSIGIIGENGAGKSTLLKIISGILEPSSGTVKNDCRMAMLIELGAGFDEGKSGYENIFIKALLLGMSRVDVQQKLESIIEFSGLGENIHAPVRHYSSGMVVRLGFSICTAVAPDLLITDEVLAVGDESFQKRCVAWIDNYLKKGGTLLMVSHSMYMITRLCTSAVWLKGGHIHMQGDAHQVTQAYLSWHQERSRQTKDLSQKKNSGHYQIKTLRCLDNNGEDQQRFQSPADITMEMVLIGPDGRAPVAGIGIVRIDGTAIYGVSSDFDQASACHRTEDDFTYRVQFKDIQLLPGKYEIRGHALDPEGMRVCDTQAVTITLTDKTQELGIVRLQHEWLK